MNCLQPTRSGQWTRTSNNLCLATSRFFFEPTPAHSFKKGRVVEELNFS